MLKCRYVVAKSTHQIPEIPAIKYFESVNFFFRPTNILSVSSTDLVYFSRTARSSYIFLRSYSNCHSYQEKTKIATIIHKQDLMLLEEGLLMESHSFGSQQLTG